jgi:Holliday junction DNA helicase RuvA
MKFCELARTSSLPKICSIQNSYSMLTRSEFESGGLAEVCSPMNENIGLIQSIKGIGSKTAQRVILELKDKCKKDTLFVEAGAASHDASFGIKQEALAALVTLGIPRVAAEKNVDQLLKAHPDSNVEQLIKLALR